MTRWIAVGLVATSMGAAGCAKPAGTDAEVPKAGPAAKPAPDAGPAPSGQLEPGGEKPAETTPAATPASDAKSADAPQTSTTTQGDVQPVAFEEKKADAAAKSDVQVKIIDWKKTEELIASHKGKVVVVDMWSLSCDPCRKEFPNLVKLHNQRKDQVACISVSTDYAGIKSKPPEFYKAKVLEFLTEQKATFENVLCSVDSETLFDQLSLASIPAVYVYGKDGKLAKRFAGEEVHYDKEVVPLVEELLAK